MVRYRAGIHTMPDGSVLYLPGSVNFAMPQALPGDIDIFDISVLQQFPLGTKLVLNDNIFRYVEFGGTTVAGEMLQAEGPDPAHDDLAPNGTGSGASLDIGSKIISFSDSLTLVENEYEGGHMYVMDTSIPGYTYMIEKNEAAGGVSNANFTIKHGLKLALTATSNLAVIKSRWKEVIQMPSSQTAQLCGVSLAIGADGSFGWVCTKGPWAVLFEDTGGAAVIGHAVRASSGTNGAVEKWDNDDTAAAVDNAIVGYVADVGVDGAFGLVNLHMDS